MIEALNRVRALLSIPLPFLAGFVFVVALHQSLKGVDLPGTRRYFYAFLALYALQGMGVGLRFGYGLDALAPVLPITAAAMAPLAYLAFRGLAATPPVRPWLHVLPPLAVAFAVQFWRDVVDPLLLVIFLGYGATLYRLTLMEEDAVAEAALQRRVPALRAARLTAGLMIFFALSDAALAAFTMAYGAAYVPEAVSVMNLGAMVIVLAYYFAPEWSVFAAGNKVPERNPPASPADALAIERVAAALEADGLFKDENLSLAKLARRAGMAPRDVSGAINRATDLNVSQYVNNRRIEEAQRLLKDTDRLLLDVMMESGFFTKSNFNREFRRVTGKSPSQWRKEAKQPAGRGRAVS